MLTLRHGIIIRLHFPPDDPRAPWRLSFFESMCLPRLLRQTEQNFEIWVRCHPGHNEVLAAMNPKVNPCQGKGAEDGLIGIPQTDKPFVLSRFHIQTRMDSDDLVSEDFVARIQAEALQHPDRPVVISFQPWKLDLWTLTRYRMGIRYNENCGSMFLSLYQPNIGGEDYRQIYDYRHGQIGQDLPGNIPVVTIEEGYCDLVVHGGNMCTSIAKSDKPLAGTPI